jgi:GTP-binding protein HflX
MPASQAGRRGFDPRLPLHISIFRFDPGSRNIDRVLGNTPGLKPAQLKALQRLLRRRIPPDRITTHEFNRELARVSRQINRQVGVLVDRSGHIEQVVVGDAGGILLPRLKPSRIGITRLCGLRLVHTHLKEEPLSDDDLTDLALLRLDLILAVKVTEEGYPGDSHLAHILPGEDSRHPFETYPPVPPGSLDLDFQELIASLEEELARGRSSRAGPESERAMLVKAVSKKDIQRPFPGWREREETEIAELRDLALSSGVWVVEKGIQHRDRYHPRYIVGEGKLKELTIRALQTGAGVLIFDHNLSPAQVNAVQDYTGLKVIDRTQLILDIFAQRAHSREGKIQVELAQLKYLLPRLVGHGVDMTRLAGGIGTRGPGETKLEVDRRRVRDRINRLERELESVRKSRAQRRFKRERRGVPVVSIVGYTNAGKSTLLNALTESSVEVAERMFSTLDPSSRRLRFPRERDIIITDTVGFIRDLPPDLLSAFRATLEELDSARLILNIVDASTQDLERRVQAVDMTLEELDLKRIPILLVLNKMDRLSSTQQFGLLKRFPDAVMISAIDRETFLPLLKSIEEMLWGAEVSPETEWKKLGYGVQGGSS